MVNVTAALYKCTHRNQGVFTLSFHPSNWLHLLAVFIKNWYLQMNSNASMKYNSQLGLYSSSFLERDHWPEASRHQKMY